MLAKCETCGLRNDVDPWNDNIRIPCPKCGIGTMVKVSGFERLNFALGLGRGKEETKLPYAPEKPEKKEPVVVETDEGDIMVGTSVLEALAEGNHHASKTKPFPCPECDKSFNTDRGLARHKGWVHRRKKPHSCPHCEKSFTSDRGLRIHIGTVHPNILKPFSRDGSETDYQALVKELEKMTGDYDYRGDYAAGMVAGIRTVIRLLKTKATVRR